MERSKMIQDVLKCYEELDKIQMNGIDGWCNLATLGTKLSANGIDYKGMGYGRLKDFMSSLNIFDFEADRNRQVPILYVCKKQNPVLSANLQKSRTTPKNVQTPSLFDWAYMGHYDSMMQDLAELALDETWSLGSSSKLVILDSYLRYTFNKLWTEGKICYTQDDTGKKYAAFNTGLVDDLYKPIYALFKENTRGPQEWTRDDFCVAGEDSGKKLVSLFDTLPPAANYFTNLSDLLYDTSKGTPILDSRHIIIENIQRFPYAVLKEFAPEGFEILRTENLTEEETKKYFEELKQAMQEDRYIYRKFNERLKSVVDLSVERVKWNYKSAIPMYYPNRKKMCLLLPLIFGRNNKVELALVVSKGKSGNYQGETIYPLDWAYKCARLVCRPDSDWLSADKIQSSQRNENE